MKIIRFAVSLFAFATVCQASDVMRTSFGSHESWALSLHDHELIVLQETKIGFETHSLWLRCDVSQAAELDGALRKFQEWAQIAQKENISSLEKQITKIGKNVLTFRAESMNGHTSYRLGVSDDILGLSFRGVREVRELLAQLPQMEAERDKSAAAISQLK